LLQFLAVIIKHGEGMEIVQIAEHLNRNPDRITIAASMVKVDQSHHEMTDRILRIGMTDGESDDTSIGVDDTGRERAEDAFFLLIQETAILCEGLKGFPHPELSVFFQELELFTEGRDIFRL
jgi:hypothetical protein